MSAVRRLCPVLGDQLSFDLASLAGLEAERDAVLMVEVMEEASHVPHHPQKITLIFSAMRHFAEALKARGFRVHYVRLDDSLNTGSVPAELHRWQSSLQPEEIHLTETGDWRLEHSIKTCGLAIQWHSDTRFLCSRGEFSDWAQGKTAADGVLLPGDAPQKSVIDQWRRHPGRWRTELRRGKSQSVAQERAGALPRALSTDAITQEVIALVRDRFSSHYGALDSFDYPVTHAEAQSLWEYFLDYGLAGFGDYQDAMASDEPFLSTPASAPR